jgi:hypothetical protein
VDAVVNDDVFDGEIGEARNETVQMPLALLTTIGAAPRTSEGNGTSVATRMLTGVAI